MNGFFLVDKPIGLTSHDVVRQIKRKFHLNKVGHTGTLDPFASGLLIVCVGKSTKLSHILTGQDKSYKGTLDLGKHYDSYDTTGQVINEKPYDVSDELLKTAMQSFVGGYDQEPPMHSAIKINGQKLYKLAHKGETIQRPKRPVMINQFNLISFENNHMTFDVNVSKGTYIRSLAVDLAHKLHTVGALSMLRRTSIGNYHIADAKPVEALETSDLITLNTYFKDLPVVVLNDYMIKLVKNGVMLDERQTKMNKPFVVNDELGNFIAYYEPVEDMTYKPVIIA